VTPPKLHVDADVAAAVARSDRVIIAGKDCVKKGEYAGLPKNVVEFALRNILGAGEIEWEWEEAAIDYVVGRVLGGESLGRALVGVVSSDMPLGRSLRAKIAGDLANFYFPNKRAKTRYRNSLIAAFATDEKTRLQKAGMSATEAEAKAAAKFGKSVDAIRQHIKRERRAHREWRAQRAK
jgi:hypothetical protein